MDFRLFSAPAKISGSSSAKTGSDDLKWNVGVHPNSQFQITQFFSICSILDIQDLVLFWSLSSPLL